MPIYEYYCEKCDTVSETIENYGDADNEHVCPLCGNTMRRQVNFSGGIHFKGSGWTPKFKSSNILPK